MSQTLRINGKEYVPSNILAEENGYTSDYIGRLAREEKILATLIGRQWFVEPESLKSYLHQVAVEKEIRKEELRRQRKVEQVTHLRKKSAGKHAPLIKEFSALASAAAIFACLFFSASLVHVASSEGLAMRDLKVGAHEVLAYVRASVLPQNVRLFEPVANTASVASSADVRPAVPERYAVLPQTPALMEEGTSTLTNGFSDPVRIRLREDGAQIVEPVIGTGTAAAFLLVPLNGVTE
jgi:hypothetical protein